MKKVLLLLLSSMMIHAAKSQTADAVWGLGIEGGGQQYNGSYGDGFYKSKNGFGGFGGVSAYRYLSPHFDFGLIATGGNMVYKSNGVTLLSNTFYQVNANVKFSFFKYDNVRLRPFLMLGLGDSYLSKKQQGEGTNGDVMVLPDFGFGLTYKVSPLVNIKLQECFVYPIRSVQDDVAEGSYLLHSIGISFNLGAHKKDADNDGVADKDDKCPNTPAGVEVDKMGCPLDKDGDGIPDYLDKCPDVKGVASASGCPDADGDGVADADDKCPNTPAGVAVDATGCPLDKDGDGVPDYMDDCPDVKGLASLKGCPDADGDGVADKNDRCPNTPAGVSVDAYGCPLDRDGDGVPDYLDKCPDVKGPAESNGCPVVKEAAKEIFRKALEGIEFQTGKDVIQKSSYGILNQVADVMKENPSYNLQINGYTDNKGKAEANLKLSEDRAIAVKKYLEDHGVAGNRMAAKGYGGEKPRGDNNTEAGRKLNRRVEFEVNF